MRQVKLREHVSGTAHNGGHTPEHFFFTRGPNIDNVLRGDFLVSDSNGLMFLAVPALKCFADKDSGVRPLTIFIPLYH